MKSYVFLLLSIFLIKGSFAQPSEPEILVLSVEKKVIRNNKPDTVMRQLKPDKVLIIKTTEGKIFKSSNYVNQDSAIVMVTLLKNGIGNTDTIPFQDIVKIRGKVYGSIERKAAGTIIALGGVPLTVMGYVIATLVSSPTGAVFMMLPGIGLTYSGISLMGARSFNTSDTWTLKTSPPADSQINQNKSEGN